MTEDDHDKPLELDRRRFLLRHRVRIPSTREAISHAVEQTMAAVRESGIPDGDEADIEIALREAVANAVLHGNAEAPDKVVSLRFYACPGHGMIIAIRDQGPGFDPADVPDPREEERLFLHHGRGMLLMRELLDHIEYRKGGREVVLYKTLDDDGAEPT